MPIAVTNSTRFALALDNWIAFYTGKVNGVINVRAILRKFWGNFWNLSFGPFQWTMFRGHSATWLGLTETFGSVTCGFSANFDGQTLSDLVQGCAIEWLLRPCLENFKISCWSPLTVTDESIELEPTRAGLLPARFLFRLTAVYVRLNGGQCCFRAAQWSLTI